MAGVNDWDKKAKLDGELFNLLFEANGNEDIILKKMKYLIYLGADKNAVFEGEGNSILSVAKKMKKQKVVEYLESIGAEVQKVDEIRAKELGEAIFKCGKGVESYVKKLCLLGADLDVRTGVGNTPLIDAVIEKDLEKARVLIKMGADVNAVNDSGRSAFFYAIRIEDEKFWDELLNSGVDLEQKDKQGMSALENAVYCNNFKLQKELIKRGCDVNDKDVNGESILAKAIKCWNFESVNLVVENGGDVNTINKDGITPLMLAMEVGNEDGEKMVKKLFEAKALSLPKDNSGNGAIDWGIKARAWSNVLTYIQMGGDLSDKNIECLKNFCVWMENDEMFKKIEKALEKREEEKNKKKSTEGNDENLCNENLEKNKKNNRWFAKFLGSKMR